MANPTWDDTTPTWDDTTEVQSIPMEEAPSESGLMQSAQALPVALGRGMSFGLANEAGAALGGLAGAIATQLDPRQNITREEILATLSPEVRAKATEVVRPKAEDFSNLLAEYYKVGKKGQSNVEAAAPATSFAGNIAGGIATMKLPVLSQLSSLKSVGLGGKIAEGAVKGAIAGGISGLTGEGDSIEERLGDAGTGSLVGGALGGGIPVAGAVGKAAWGGVKKVAKELGDIEILQQIPEYFKAGLQGKGLTSNKDLNKYTASLYNLAEQMGLDTSKLTGETIRKITSIVDDATNSGKTIDIKDLLEEQLGKTKKSLGLLPRDKERIDINQLQDELLDLKNSIMRKESPAEVAALSSAENYMPDELPLTPEQLYKQERGFAKVGSSKKNETYESTKERKTIVDAFKRKVAEQISPEIQTNQTKISNIKDFYKSLGIDDLSPDIEDITPEDSAKIDKFFKTLKATATPGNIVKEKQIERAFNYLSKIPEGKEIVNKYSPDMKELAKYIQMTQDVVKGRSGLAFVPGKSSVLTTANFAGKVTPEWAANTANAVRRGSTKASQFVADQLEKIAVEPNKEKINAIMFGLMQNPAYRELLGQHVEGESDER